MFNASIRHGISYDYISRQVPKYAPGATPRISTGFIFLTRI